MKTTLSGEYLLIRHLRKLSTRTLKHQEEPKVSLRPNAVRKFYLVAEYWSTFLGQFKDMLHISRFPSQHIDLQPTRTTRDESDVNSIISTLSNNWLNPFNLDLQDLICLSTGKVATPNVEHDLLQAKDIGETAYKAFHEK